MVARPPILRDVPDIDIGPLYGAKNEARAAVIRQIKQAVADVGFFFIHNSNLTQGLVDKAYSQSRLFHALPDGPDKRRLHKSHSPQRRGWTPAGEEPAYEVGTKSTCESFDLARELPAEPVTGAAGNLGPNVWPEGLPGFREDVYTYYLEAIRLGQVLFGAFAEVLGLPQDRFARLSTERAPSTMRLLHYPAYDGPEDERHLGISAHCDFECFTIMHQTAPGLEVMRLSGEWLQAPVREGRFLIILGDMLERWTNGTLKATRHRVVNSARERYSIIFFSAVDGDVVVEPLAEFVSDDNPPRYRPVTQQQHLSQEVADAQANLAAQQQ